MRKQVGFVSFIMGAFACSLTAVGAVPAISDVTMAQDPVSRLVTISYRMSQGPGIVTLDIQTNGVSIGAANLRFLAGDVNKEVKTDGLHTITWRPNKSWQGDPTAKALAKVSVWERSAPPDYMAVGLTTPYSVSWYTCEDALPGGIDSDRYREDVLLMRRICRPVGGKWVMGSPAINEETGRVGEWEAQHEVTLTNDFWIGVFEVTQKQWSLINGGQPSIHGGDHWATRPVDAVKYIWIRDTEYPQAPSANSFLGKLRSITGMESFDLPSEMQWEYACRATTGTALNNGQGLTDGWAKDPAMDQVGRYLYNGGEKEKHTRVGSYLPNNWGLYDMHGNVWEWCLDWFAEDITGLDGKVNTAQGSERVARGGSWGRAAANARSAYRFKNIPEAQDESFGFRVVCREGL